MAEEAKCVERHLDVIIGSEVRKAIHTEETKGITSAEMKGVVADFALAINELQNRVTEHHRGLESMSVVPGVKQLTKMWAAMVGGMQFLGAVYAGQSVDVATIEKTAIVIQVLIGRGGEETEAKEADPKVGGVGK